MRCRRSSYECLRTSGTGYPRFIGPIVFALRPDPLMVRFSYHERRYRRCAGQQAFDDAKYRRKLQTMQAAWFAGEYDYKVRKQSAFGGAGTPGLYYLRARFYDPTLGRFLTQDPLRGFPTAPQSLNRYAYARDNPVNQVDPSGLLSEGGDFFGCNTGLLIVAALLIVVGLGVGGLYLWTVAPLLAGPLTFEALHAAAELGWLGAAGGLIGLVGGGLAIDKACGGRGDLR